MIEEKMTEQVRINLPNDMYIVIRWAKVFDNPIKDKPVKVADFSGDLHYKDGLRLCNLNKMNIVASKDETGTVKYYVGSMSSTLPRGDKIYAITWFPDCRDNNSKAIKIRDKFGKDAMVAVERFSELALSQLESK